jgi:hypothetical protein
VRSQRCILGEHARAGDLPVAVCVHECDRHYVRIGDLVACSALSTIATRTGVEAGI